MVSTINYSLIWRLGIPACILLASYSIWSMTLRHVLGHRIGIPFVAVLILTIEKSVANDSVWWVTGFYNYLMPVSLGLYCLSVFIREEQASRASKALSLPLVFIACSAEQPAICVLLSCMLVAAFKRKLSSYYMIFLIVAIASSSILFLSPGNYSRFIVESSRYMPEIHSYGLFQKVSFGLDRLHTHLRSAHNKTFLLSLILTIIFAVKTKSYKGLQGIVCTSILVIAVFIFLSIRWYTQTRLSYLNGIFQFSPVNWSLFYSYTSFAFSLLTICSMLWMSLKDNANGATAFIALAVATIVTVAIGMSPTVYESGQRVLFVFDIGLIIYICDMVSRIVKSMK